MTIAEITKKYHKKIDYFDLEILIANSLGKTREFILANPEYEIPKFKIQNLKFKISRRMRGEPIAYILGHKEFYGLDFIVNKHTLVPRPETEQIIDLAIHEAYRMKHTKKNVCVVDIGTGSGNIITSIANKLEKDAIYNPPAGEQNTIYYAVDISKEALKIAKKNARFHKLDKKIKFLEGNLLSPIIGNWKLPARPGEIGNSTMIIVANLPYLSKKVFQSAPIDVKKYEPKTALYSAKNGLAHYEKLLKQIKKLLISCYMFHVICYMEISPEQKHLLQNIIKAILPKAKTTFHKDLAKKWRIVKIEI